MKTKDGKIYLSWDDVEEFIDRITVQIKQTILHPHSYEIATIPRGGLIPATMLAHKLGIKKIWTFPPFEFDDPIINATMPSIETGIFFVDDIYDTGNTYHRVKNMLFEYNFKPCFLVIKHPPQNIPQPFYPGRTLFDSKWVVFPWEV